MRPIAETQEIINKLHAEYISKVIEIANECEERVLLQPLKVKPYRYLHNDLTAEDQPFLIRVEKISELVNTPEAMYFGNVKPT